MDHSQVILDDRGFFDLILHRREEIPGFFSLPFSVSLYPLFLI